MTTKGKRINSDWAIPPGEGLQEEAEFRGITTREMAELCGESVKNIEGVYRGAREITSELADKLEKILGIGAYVWLGLEEDYQETLRRNGESRPE